MSETNKGVICGCKDLPPGIIGGSVFTVQ